MKLSSTVSFLLAAFTISVVNAATTPGLINQAAQEGSISPARRLELLAYWIYEPSSLPAEFEGNEATFGTRYVREIDRALKDSSPSQELLRVTGAGARSTSTYCSKADGAIFYNSTNFAFTYDTIGGGLTIDAYKTSLETVFAGYVTSYGWQKPPLKDVNINSGPGKYPVQVAAIGDSLFGYVSSSGGLYSGYIDDTHHEKASCMVLNSDFAQFGEPGAQGNLDGTTSHEYVHAIQFGIGDPDADENNMWYESVAVYMEDELYDSANTQYAYLFPDTTNCLGAWPNEGDPFNISEYSNFVMFRHMAEHNGGTNEAGGGENVIQKLWENIGLGQTGLTALNAALVTAGTNLNDAFHKYAIAVRFSKNCGASYAAPYCFEEGDAYVDYVGTDTIPDQGTVSTVPGSYDGSVKDHYAINYVDLPTTGSYIVSLQNSATGGSIRGTVVCDNGSSFTMQALPSVVGPSETTQLESEFDASGCTKVTAVLTNQAKTEDDPASCTSDTYTLSTLTAPPTTSPTKAPVGPPTTSPAPTTSDGGDDVCSGLFSGIRCK